VLRLCCERCNAAALWAAAAAAAAINLCTLLLHSHMRTLPPPLNCRIPPATTLMHISCAACLSVAAAAALPSLLAKMDAAASMLACKLREKHPGSLNDSEDLITALQVALIFLPSFCCKSTFQLWPHSSCLCLCMDLRTRCWSPTTSGLSQQAGCTCASAVRRQQLVHVQYMQWEVLAHACN
jgi:hypothetical protein